MNVTTQLWIAAPWLALISAAFATGSKAPRVGDPAPEPGAHAPRAVRYGRDIRPLLSDRCFECHGPDENTRAAGLRLDLREEAIAEWAIVPGEPEESTLYERIATDDVDDRMPPEDSKKKLLTPEEVELVRQWIEDGAEYEEHWAFVAPQRPEVPVNEPVRGARWERGAIDAFVLEELQARDIAPSPETDPVTLLRRVFHDLTGLPPTPEEIDAFLVDAESGVDAAYERVVERLLTEEPYVTRYAERMAVPWLDAARYADTSGIHMDAGRQIWPWRDWVLNALRDGMPFDQFVTEQLAGDLLPDATVAQKVASGFNRNHVTTDEGGAINEEYLVEYAVDRTSTTSAVFMGLTMGCARCHDHKYDPVSQEEFYSLYAYFNSNEEPGLYSQIPDAKRALEPFMIVPSGEQEQAIAALEDEVEAAKLALEAPIDGELERRASFFDEAREKLGLTWLEGEDARLVSAKSDAGAALELQGDGSVLAVGDHPDFDAHAFELETDAQGLRFIALEALLHESLPFETRVGLASNGNAVLGSIHVEAVSLANPERRERVELAWAWADVEQLNGDYRVVNALEDSKLGWAVDAHNQDGPRRALFLAKEPFGFEGGTRVIVRLEYDSVYAKHTFGRVRLTLGSGADGAESESLDALGMASSGWYATAPFSLKAGASLFEEAFGPESMVELDTTLKFAQELNFNYVPTFLDDRLNGELAGGPSVTYVAKRLFVPTDREVELSLGSDDGFRLFLDGQEVAKNEVARGLAKDQDRATLTLSAGRHTVVMKIVNTGGPGGYYWREERRAHEFTGGLIAAFLPERARDEDLGRALQSAWRFAFSPEHRERVDELAALEKELAEASAAIPKTMVMKELEEPRPTYVLMRGQYDAPDESRPVERGVPAALGSLPEDAPKNRLGLARWLTAPENPLLARVTVNRLWEQCFGTGIVATSEDFGMQGDWPSHPELLDWLAVEFRTSGWDLKSLMRRIVTSSTYRQSSRVRPELEELDPDSRLLARFPRRRLTAEQIRDQALYVSGLLVERLGGPSVKPYQPEGLWKEVAMVQSNTRNFERGDGEELWRRSLYTYWKRASPPPSMLTFDAPTREFCTIRRGRTATPLQSLVLWNDEQFVEAARKLAERTLTEPLGDELTGDERAMRLTRMVRRCTGRAPEPEERDALLGALDAFLERYGQDGEGAAALLAVGDAPLSEAGAELDLATLAAWTMIANALFSLDATICQG